MIHTKLPANSISAWSVNRVKLNGWDFYFISPAAGCFCFALSFTAVAETMCEKWDCECLYISLARACFLFRVTIQNRLSQLLSHCHQSKTPSRSGRLWSFGAMGQDLFFSSFPLKWELSQFLTHNRRTHTLTSLGWLSSGFLWIGWSAKRMWAHPQMPTWPHCIPSVS